MFAGVTQGSLRSPCFAHSLALASAVNTSFFVALNLTLLLLLLLLLLWVGAIHLMIVVHSCRIS